MQTVCKINKCNGCMACIDACPKDCISVIDDIYCYNAVINNEQCIKCNLCKRVCPNEISVKKNNVIAWFQGWGEDQIRQLSSSGGAASSIIRSFILSGGYVASCLFKEGSFGFDITNELEVAKQFAGSKYVKSNPAGIYKKVADRLKTDRVLFIGLPCQVAALKNYVRNTENLYTVDLICHGTPSPILLDKFLKENGYDIKELKDIKFRKKTSMKIYGDDKPICPEGLDDYLISFLVASDYTENCYGCQFATFERISDITLGDSWGTELVEEERNGVSLLLIQSDKGKELIANANLTLKDVDIEKAKRENYQLQHPSVMTDTRERFLKLISNEKSFAYATFICFKKKIIKRRIKKVLIKLNLMKKPGGGYGITIVK